HRAAQQIALIVAVLPGAAAGLQETVGDHVQRLVRVEALPLARTRGAVEGVGLPAGGVHELLAGRALGAQAAAGDGGVGVAFDPDDLLVLDVHALPTAHRAVGADALHHPVGGGRTCGGGPRGGGGDRCAASERIAG